MKKLYLFLLTIMVSAISTFAQSGLQNADFAEGALGDVNIATYAKDGDVHQMQEVPGWTIGVENGDARAAGVVAYGSNTTLGGSDYKAPAAGPEGTNGNALAVVGVWTGTVKYVQDVTLPAGKYTMTVPVYNTAGTSAFVKNLIGVKYGETEVLASTKLYSIGKWIDETIVFELSEETTVTVSLGYEGANVGSGASQHLFYDCVKIETYDEVAVAKAAALAALPTGDESIFTPNAEDVEAVKAAIEAATTADEVEAAAATELTIPALSGEWTIFNTTANNYLGYEEAQPKLVADVATATFTQVDGGFAIKVGDAYINMKGGNTWSMSADAEVKTAWNFTLTDGKYTIKGPNGLIGSDGTDAGEFLFGNKAIANNGLWVIEPYVVPDPLASTLAVTAVEGKTYLTDKINIGENTYDTYKIGTSSATGTIGVTIPAGSYGMSFYALSWSTASTKITATAGEKTEEYTATGGGISGNSPYTYDAEKGGELDTHLYTFAYSEPLAEDVVVTLTAPARAIFFGINALTEAPEVGGWDGTVTSSLDDVVMKSVAEFEGITLKFNGAKSIVLNSIEEDGETIYGSFEAWNPDYTQYFVWSPSFGSTYEVNGDEVTLTGWIDANQMMGGGAEFLNKVAQKRARRAPEGDTDYQFEMMDYGETFVIDGKVYEDQIDLFFNAEEAKVVEPFEFSVINNEVEIENTKMAEAEAVSVMFQINSDYDVEKGEGVPTLSVNGEDQGEATVIIVDGVGVIKFEAAPAATDGLFTAAGTYTLTIPEGTFVDVNGAPNALYGASWVIIEGGDPDPEKAVIPALIYDEDEVTLNNHTLVSVEAAEALKVSFENMPEVIGATYAINKMNMITDEEGTFWTVGEEMAVGEMYLNSIAYAQFEEPLTFMSGDKYQLSVTAFANPADPTEIGTYTFQFNGATEPEVKELIAGDYLIMNVENGKYLNGGNDWGTKVSVTEHGQFMTLELNDGKYAIKSHYSNGNSRDYVAAGDNTYLDAAIVYHTIEPVKGGFAIKDSNDKYLVSDGNVANFNGDEPQVWQFITKDELIASLAEATAEDPIDATALVPDANFSRNNIDFNKWEGESKMTKGGPNNATGATTRGMNAERWGGNSNSIDFHTTLTDLPNGKYTIKFQGLYRYNNTTENTNDIAAAAHADGTEKIIVNFYANEASVPFISVADEAAVATYGKMPFSQAEASEAFSLGCYQQEFEAEVTDGTLTLKVEKLEADHEGCDWTVLDNIELYYQGADANEELVIPAFIYNGDEIALNNRSLVSVEGAEALKVTFENMPLVFGATYSINQMDMHVEEEGTFWTVGKEIEVGEMSVNAIAYTEFDSTIKFLSGTKYQLSVTAFVNPSDPTEIGTYTFQFNGASEATNYDVDVLFSVEDEAEIKLDETKSINITVALPEGAQATDDLVIMGTLYGQDGTSEPILGFTTFEEGANVDISRLTPGNAYTIAITKIAYGQVVDMDPETYLPIYENEIVAEEGDAIATLLFTIFKETSTETPETTIHGEGTTLYVDFAVGTDLGDNYTQKPYLVDAEENKIEINDYTTDNTTGGFFDPLNRVIITLSEQLADGVYTLVIPAGTFIVDGGDNNAEWTYSVTVNNGVMTAISGINANNSNKTIYTLSGVRVNKAVKGINIINGKKVILK